jgi:hypothetical protein
LLSILRFTLRRYFSFSSRVKTSPETLEEIPIWFTR